MHVGSFTYVIDVQSMFIHKVGMDAVIARLAEVMKTLNELKEENSILRKEIFGVGVSAFSSQSMGLMENKTLREIVEETQFQVKALNTKFSNYEEQNVHSEMSNSMDGVNQRSTGNGQDRRRSEESEEEIQVAEIRSKTIAEERNWMKATFNELKPFQTIEDGESFGGRTVQNISSSFNGSGTETCAITMKFSNYLDYALTDKYYVDRIMRTSTIDGHTSEVISGVNGRYKCSLACSFEVSRLLSLIVYCDVDLNGNISFAIGLTPPDVDPRRDIEKLLSTLKKMSNVPEVWIQQRNSTQPSNVPLELFVNHGNFIARGHMTVCPRSIVHVEILEMIGVIGLPYSQPRRRARIVNGESIKPHFLKGTSGMISRSAGRYGRVACNIEIINCLTVNLLLRSQFNRNCEYNAEIPLEVRSCQREEFFAANNSGNVEAMFSYEIVSTDFAFVVGMHVGDEFNHTYNSFRAAFLQLPAVSGPDELQSLMFPHHSHWKTHRHRKYATAEEGVQLIQMGNIRAEIITDDEGRLGRLYGGIYGDSKIGATIIDSLDTLFIMGFYEEYIKGRNWVSENFDFKTVKTSVSLFETNIRILGGFLTAYALTRDDLYLDQANAVGQLLLPAFDTPSGFPFDRINPATGATGGGATTSMAGLGLLHLEFAYLSEITANPIYLDKVSKIRQNLWDLEKPNGLYPNTVNIQTGRFSDSHVSMGAGADSFYEYLLKSWIQTQDREARQMYDEAMDAFVANDLVRVSKQSHLLYIGELSGARIDDVGSHLEFFAGGMFALGSVTTDPTIPGYGNRDHDMEIGQNFTNTCHESYIRSDSHIGPEVFRFTDTAEAVAVNDGEKDWAWDSAQAIEKYTKAGSGRGYSGLRNVYSSAPVQDDVQQTFFLAETLKYLYLVFSTDDLIDLDKWVFNTECHPLPVKGKNPMF
ncbi:unnamed protein product [Allacma fusca]|uniref:Alpha-1,2-Mannosidase n=1 Tax=Allacma fusca TaxID=39272 RepID=A0A8J2KVV2_9HEXA|nr:unnamed protein product [Allacma fusca]